MRKLEPFTGHINFEPSYKQYLVWNQLLPNHCDKCGGELEMRPCGINQNGDPIFKPTCKKCGTTDIPRLILYGGAAGSGKAQLLDSQVVTPFGLRKNRDLKVGDTITNPVTGGMQKIIYLHPVSKNQYYRIVFSDGAYTDCSSEHIWKLHQSSERSKSFRKYGGDRDRLWTAQQVYEWYQRKKNGICADEYLIAPLTEPVRFTVANRLVPIDPYILGFIIGDGCISDIQLAQNVVTVTTMDQEVVDRFIECGYDMSVKYPAGNAFKYSIRDKELIDSIKKLWIAGNKSQTHAIPKGYLYGTLEERKRLMQGLMDADGYVDKGGRLYYYTTSKQLAEDVTFIVRSLGGVCTTFEDVGSYKDKSGEKRICSKVYNLYIRTKIDNELVGLTRKKKLAHGLFNGGFSELGHRISDVIDIGEKEGRCITVSDPSGLYCTDDFIVTHNSWLGTAWGLSTCIRFPGARFAIARKTLKVLRGTTWVTLMNVLRTFGLKEGVNYHLDNLNLVVTLWNGSQILSFELEDLPRDPQYARLGSVEITCGYIDEASEVTEKAVEVLLSRCRWMVAETFIVPKILMGTNPDICWLRDRFVQDENGVPLDHLPEGYRFVPATVADNKDPRFVAVYMNNLLNIKDPYTRNRLLYGLWDDPKGNSNAAYHSYDSTKHVKQNLRERVYNKLKPIIVSYDFNTNPYCTAILIQIDYDAKNLFVLEEILGKPKEKANNTPALAKMVSDTLMARGHLGGVIITGDPAGLGKTTATADGVNNFTIIKQFMNNDVLRPRIELLTKQPAHITRLDFINQLFEGYDGWSIQIDYRCHKLCEDFVRQMKNDDGTKSKHLGYIDGVKCETLGHCSDAFDYAVVKFLGKMYTKFKAHVSSPIITVPDSVSAYDTANQWDY